MRHWNIGKLTCFAIVLVCLVCHSCQRNDRKTDSGKSNFKSAVVKKDTVLLVSMSFNETRLIPKIASGISSFYHLPVKHISAPLPPSAYYAPRNRYKGDTIIKYLSPLKRDHYRFVAGFTSKDISTKKNGMEDWGIFGLGSLDNGGCITSSYRLRKNASEKLLLERLQKVVLHEMGHNFGLPHCITGDPCNMVDAQGKISTVDGNPMDICTGCKSKIEL